MAACLPHLCPTQGPRGTTPGGAIHKTNRVQDEGCPSQRVVGRFQPCPPHFWPPLHSSVQPRRVSSPLPLRGRPGHGAREDWPAKVSCAVGPASRLSKRAPAPRPALPAPPRPAASEPPRPWPGARASSAAQMPRRSRRVGTCPGPGAGAWAATASPLGQPGSCFLELLLILPWVGPGGRPPRRPLGPPGSAGSPRAVVSRAPLRRKSAGGGPLLPVPPAGALLSVRWAAGRGGRRGRPGGSARGRVAGTGRAAHARAAGGEAAERAQGEPSPTRPGAASRRAGVCAAPRESESCSRGLWPEQLRCGRREEELRGALPGMVSGPAGWAAAPSTVLPQL